MFYLILAILAVALFVINKLAKAKPLYTVLSEVAGNDSWCLLDTPQNQMYINSFMIVDKIDIETVKDMIVERGVNQYHRLRKRVVYVGSVPHWETHTGFDIHDHVKECPDKTEFNKAKLSEYVSSLWHTSLPEDKPLWRFELIRNYEGDRSALVIRIHHVIADGISLVRFLLSILDPQKDDGKHAKVGLKKPGVLDLVKKIALYPKALAGNFVRRADNNALHGPSLSGHRRVAWSNSIPLDRVKACKNALGTSLNDVLMGSMTMALRSYMLKHNSHGVVEDLTVNVPITLRAKAPPGVLNNMFSLVTMPLPCGMEGTNMDVLKETNKRMTALKDSSEPIGNFITLKILSKGPSLLAQWSMDFLASKDTATFTNVPGPTSYLYGKGRKIHDLMFWVPSTGNIGIGISILSYAGGVKIAVAADTAVCEDPQELITCFESEFAKYESEAKTA